MCLVEFGEIICSEDISFQLVLSEVVLEVTEILSREDLHGKETPEVEQEGTAPPDQLPNLDLVMHLQIAELVLPAEDSRNGQHDHSHDQVINRPLATGDIPVVLLIRSGT